jgi:hypothetical protein
VVYLLSGCPWCQSRLLYPNPLDQQHIVATAVTPMIASATLAEPPRPATHRCNTPARSAPQTASGRTPSTSNTSLQPLPQNGLHQERAKCPHFENRPYSDHLRVGTMHTIGCVWRADAIEHLATISATIAGIPKQHSNGNVTMERLIEYRRNCSIISGGLLGSFVTPRMFFAAPQTTGHFVCVLALN